MIWARQNGFIKVEVCIKIYLKILDKVDMGRLLVEVVGKGFNREIAVGLAWKRENHISLHCCYTGHCNTLIVHSVSVCPSPP